MKAVDNLSIGFRPKRSIRGRYGSRDVTYLHEVDLMEVSLVTFAANEGARILEVKSDMASIDVIEGADAESVVEIVEKSDSSMICKEVDSIEWSVMRCSMRAIRAGMPSRVEELCDYLKNN